MSHPPSSFECKAETASALCVLSNALDVDSIIKSVKDDSAGAIAVFIGTTRNNFEGKTVTYLEYQAYSKLAIKTMLNIVQNVQKDAALAGHDLIHCAVHHRIGSVPVGEPSIVIAVSSPHRKEAFEACENILEGVKRHAQIWKREFYAEDSEARWKANEYVNRASQ